MKRKRQSRVAPFNRAERQAAGEAIAALEPDAMRTYLLEAPISRGGRLWCDRVLEGVDAGERTALRLFGEAMRWCGAQVNIVAVMQERLGVRDEGELRGLVESGRRFAELGAERDDSEYRAAALSMLKALHRKHPDWAPCDAQAIAGASYAVEVNGNGAGTNGHAQG